MYSTRSRAQIVVAYTIAAVTNSGCATLPPPKDRACIESRGSGRNVWFLVGGRRTEEPAVRELLKNDPTTEPLIRRSDIFARVGYVSLGVSLIGYVVAGGLLASGHGTASLAVASSALPVGMAAPFLGIPSYRAFNRSVDVYNTQATASGICGNAAVADPDALFPLTSPRRAE
jgi:hypothetical protein